MSISINDHINSSMSFDSVLKAVNSKKTGTYFKIRYKKNVTLSAKAKASPIEVVKIVDCLVRAGIDYSNMKTTIEARANAGPNAEKSGSMSWGTWIKGHEKIFLDYTTKTGEYKKYLRVYPKNTIQSKYFIRVNGGNFCEVSKDFLLEMGYVTPSNVSSKPTTCMNIDTNNILHIW